MFWEPVGWLEPFGRFVSLRMAAALLRVCVTKVRVWAKGFSRLVSGEEGVPCAVGTSSAAELGTALGAATAPFRDLIGTGGSL